MEVDFSGLTDCLLTVESTRDSLLKKEEEGRLSTGNNNPFSVSS